MASSGSRAHESCVMLSELWTHIGYIQIQMQIHPHRYTHTYIHTLNYLKILNSPAEFPTSDRAAKIWKTWHIDVQAGKTSSPRSSVYLNCIWRSHTTVQISQPRLRQSPKCPNKCEMWMQTATPTWIRVLAKLNANTTASGSGNGIVSATVCVSVGFLSWKLFLDTVALMSKGLWICPIFDWVGWEIVCLQ